MGAEVRVTKPQATWVLRLFGDKGTTGTYIGSLQLLGTVGNGVLTLASQVAPCTEDRTDSLFVFFLGTARIN